MLLFVFFFKQKTAYEMRISDWSSDVCSSDLKVLNSSVQMRLICDDFKFSSWNRTAAGKRTLARKAADAIRISPAGSPVAYSRAMEAPLNPAVLESPQERHTAWASVVELLTYIGVFDLAPALPDTLISFQTVD